MSSTPAMPAINLGRNLPNPGHLQRLSENVGKASNSHGLEHHLLSETSQHSYLGYMAIRLSINPRFLDTLNKVSIVFRGNVAGNLGNYYGKQGFLVDFTLHSGKLSSKQHDGLAVLGLTQPFFRSLQTELLRAPAQDLFSLLQPVLNAVHLSCRESHGQVDNPNSFSRDSQALENFTGLYWPTFGG